ncbi:MAG: HAD family hydrolase [Nanoarchaeota archaeon]
MAIPQFPLKEGTKSQIIELLSKNNSLSARRLFFEIKKQYNTPITYQAVHKTLQDLLQKNVITKKDKDYSIKEQWLDELDYFCEETRKNIRDKHKCLIKKETLKTKSNKKIKVIGFNLDACLSDIAFDELFWRTEIPKLYAKQNKITFEEAYKRITNKYRKMWGKTNRWRDPQFWCDLLNLNVNWEILVENIQKEIKFYGDVLPVLQELSKNYNLIVITRADRKFLDLKLNTGKLNKFFIQTYSTTTDFAMMNKETLMYKEICNKLKVQPSEMIYVGNDYENDYHVPNTIGIRSFLLDREGNKKEEYVVRDLYELQEKIEFLD